MLSIRGTNFRACSASGKMWTFLHVQSMLSIRGTNLIAHWAYGELISSHAEHTGNRFHCMLSMRVNVEKSNISAESNRVVKNLVLQAHGTIRFRFLQKKSKKNFMLVYLFKSSAYPSLSLVVTMYCIYSAVLVTRTNYLYCHQSKTSSSKKLTWKGTWR
jgi:hypothetical protein